MPNISSINFLNKKYNNQREREREKNRKIPKMQHKDREKDKSQAQAHSLPPSSISFLYFVIFFAVVV